jgi:hypothetical protein
MRAVLLLSALALAVGIDTASAQLDPSIDPFLCYRAKPSRGAARFAGAGRLVLGDRFQTAPADVTKARGLCTPADVGDAGTLDDETQLSAYQVKTPVGAVTHVPRSRVHVTNQLGTLIVDTLRPEGLLVPANLDADGDPGAPDPEDHELDGYSCYTVRTTRGTPRFPRGLSVTVADQFSDDEPRTYDVGRPRQLCVPTEIAEQDIKHPTEGLMCYRVHRARTSAKPAPGHRLDLHDALGSQVVDPIREDMLCLPSVIDDELCNGSSSLCTRRYDQVAYATTHNAMSNGDEGWLLPNQQHGISRQLDDGIRALMLDTHYFGAGDEVDLCHEYCELGREPLVSGLAKIKRFLDRRPNEIVSIIFEAYVDEADVEDAFDEAGLLDYLHEQPLDQPWPTLRELIAAGTRLVVFTDERGEEPWHHYVWDYASETPFSFETPDDFTCAPNRGNPNNGLFILNHFLTQTVGRPELAQQVNYDPLFIDRALQCQAERNRLPNFVTVDFYDIGDVFFVTNALNGP